MTEAYPLAWPQGRSRTKFPQRSRFDTDHGSALSHLIGEIRRLGGNTPVISTNIPLRNDGLPRAAYRMPDDRGVAVYFSFGNQQMCFACDKWDQIHDNLFAIAKTIEALRGIKRWGSGDMVQQAFTGFVSLPAPPDHWVILGVRPGASAREINDAYRAQARLHHPDAGGSADTMARLTAARDALLKGAA